MKLFIALDPPYHWITLGPKNEPIDIDIVENLDNYRVPKGVEQVIGVARGDAIACHSVKIPGKRRKNVESALPYALEDRLTEDVEDLHFKLMSWHPDEPALAAVISNDQISEWINKFQFLGINLDAIIPEYLLLPRHPNGNLTISKVEEDRLCIRLGEFQGLSLDKSGFTYWWESRENLQQSYSVTDLNLARTLSKLVIKEQGENTGEGQIKNTINHWKIGDDFTQWFRNFELSEDYDRYSILDGNFAPTHNKKSENLLKVAAIIAVVAIVGYWGLTAFESHNLQSRKQQLDSSLRNLFSEYFPDQPYLDRPRSQLTNLIDGVKTGNLRNTEFQELMTAVSKITPAHGAVVEEINFRDSDMIVLCTVKDMASLDTITQAFNNLGSVNAELLSSGAQDGKVTGRFRLN